MLQDSAVAAAPTEDWVIKDTTTQGFLKDVIEESRRQPVLVDFWAEWCGPCKQLTPIIEKVVRAAKGKVKLAKLDIEKHKAIFQQLASQLGLQSIPAVLAFVNGQPIDGFMGALPESQVAAFIERVTKDVVGVAEQDLLKEAETAFAEGDAAGAAAIYAEVLAEDKDSLPAIAGLARCHVAAGALEEAKQTLGLVPEAKKGDAAVAAARAALDLAEQAASIGPITELEQKVAADPKDHQARFDLAVALNAQGEREKAVDHLMDIVRRDRKWNEDGARKQLVQFFEAWGPMDDATVAGRKRLSSVLFS